MRKGKKLIEENYKRKDIEETNINEETEILC